MGLAHLGAWTERRRALAQVYRDSLQGLPGLTLPAEKPYARSVQHLFVVRHARRDALARELTARGVGTLIHYPIPLHVQPAFADLGGRAGDFPEAERAAASVLSLPLYPEMTDAQARAVAAAVRESVAAIG